MMNFQLPIPTSHNNATNRGAIKNYGNITLKNANFTQNNVTSFGGAIFNEQNTILTMTETNFIKNTANLGGAIYGFYQGNLTVNDSNFINNTAEHGGAIHN